MRGSTAIRPATCVPSVLAVLAPAMWGWPGTPSCTITAAPARDGAQPGASWAVLHPAPHQLVGEHDDLRCARRPVPAHSGPRCGVGQACRRAPPARDGAQPACLWAVVHPAPHPAGQEGPLLPVVLAEPRRRARADAVRPARTRHSRQARRRASEVPRAHPTPACGGGAPVLVPHTQQRPTVATQATRSPRRDTGRGKRGGCVKYLRRASVRCALATTRRTAMPKPGFPVLARRSLRRSVGRTPQR